MVDQINFPAPQAWSGGADFSPLANLGNVYRDAQSEAAKSRALSQLGADPNANMQTLLQSGVPSLATIGLNLQQKGIEQQREDQRNAVADYYRQQNESRLAAAEARAAAANSRSRPSKIPPPAQSAWCGYRSRDQRVRSTSRRQRGRPASISQH
jgi:hypothetical protein